MWWFLNKTQKPGSIKDGGSRLQTEEQLLAQVPDLSTLAGQDVAIKIWLPELVACTLKWVANYEGTSQSGWVRDRLFVYVYGRVAQLAQYIREERTALRFSRTAVDRGAGRWIYKVPQLGKNTVAFKVWARPRQSGWKYAEWFTHATTQAQGKGLDFRRIASVLVNSRPVGRLAGERTVIASAFFSGRRALPLASVPGSAQRLANNCESSR